MQKKILSNSLVKGSIPARTVRFRIDSNAWMNKKEIPFDSFYIPWVDTKLGIEDCGVILSAEGNSIEHNYQPTLDTGLPYTDVVDIDTNDVFPYQCSFSQVDIYESDKIICIDTNDNLTKSAVVKDRYLAFSVSSKLKSEGIYAWYTVLDEYVGTGFITPHFVDTHSHDLGIVTRKVGYIDGGFNSGTSNNMPVTPNTDISIYSLYSEYDIETKQFIRNVCNIILEGASVSLMPSFNFLFKNNAKVPQIFTASEENQIPRIINKKDVLNDLLIANNEDPMFNYIESVDSSDRQVFYLMSHGW